MYVCIYIYILYIHIYLFIYKSVSHRFFVTFVVCCLHIKIFTISTCRGKNKKKIVSGYTHFKDIKSYLMDWSERGQSKNTGHHAW